MDEVAAGPAAVEPDGRAVLTVPEFRRRFGISETTFWRMEQDGEAPPIYRIRSKRVIRIEDADRWLAERRDSPRKAALREAYTPPALRPAQNPTDFQGDIGVKAALAQGDIGVKADFASGAFANRDSSIGGYDPETSPEERS